ncbi:E3 ubiquitin-protein ligase MPSR1-like [Salvia miltiorrhiza]|uniref:E3 ubiquitin-protein ligase MPSR1-like n=1 Tax=Salvia miltiorrhiza TaxID=226208 RepID=UPI0025ACD7AC|nr:E3 ubiquitin-protein ligase MPSR1-like [Salvia miltiorrhiza]
MSSSNPDSSPSPPSLEELSTRGATALLLPWILRMATAADSPPGEVAVFVHQPTRSITLVEGSLDVESLLRELPWKEGPLPATKASIESLPLVRVSEVGVECSICLAEYDEESEVKEMPCRHRFHSDCIGKWLGIHGSCPICRFGMPVEERKEGDERGGWRIHLFVARPDPDPDVDMDAGAGNWDDEEANDDESTAQNMDIHESD